MLLLHTLLAATTHTSPNLIKYNFKYYFDRVNCNYIIYACAQYYSKYSFLLHSFSSILLLYQYWQQFITVCFGYKLPSIYHNTIRAITTIHVLTCNHHLPAAITNMASPSPVPSLNRTPLAPPEPQSFVSLEQAKDYCAQHSKLHGYTIVIAHSRSNKVYLKCDCGGKYCNQLKYIETLRVHNMSTKLIGCLFSCTVILFIDT